MDTDNSYARCGRNIYGKQYYKDEKFYNKNLEEITDSGKIVQQVETVVNEVKPKKKRGRKPVKKD